MKKTVGVFILIFVVSMGVMSGWGFIDKQIKENSNPAPISTPSTNTTSSSGSSSSSSSSQPSSSDMSTTSSRSYTLSELSSHKSPSDCWLAINGNVYNVTQYLDFHPGGADIILMFCGQDATKAYNTKGGRGGGHSSRANSQLSQYIIGTLK